MANIPFQQILILLSLFRLTGGGGNHLLDYTDTNSYWKSKSVMVSADAMLAELKMPDGKDISSLIDKLNSSDSTERDAATKQIMMLGPSALPSLQKATASDEPAISSGAKALINQINLANKADNIRRLMAIRTLGELKQASALATLQPLTDSKELFVAEYAKLAIARIQGTATTQPDVIDAASRQADLELVPAGAGIELQASATALSTEPGAFVDAITKMKLPQLPMMQPGGGGMQMVAPDPAKLIEQFSTMSGNAADKIGEARFDSFTFALAADVGPNAGWVEVILRGNFDSAAVAAIIPADVQTKEMNGQKIFMPDPTGAIIIPSDDRIILLMGPNEDALPLDAITKALQQDKSDVPADDAMAKLLKKADESSSAWIAVAVNDNYRQVPGLDAVDTILAAGKSDGKQLNFKAVGAGTDAQKTKAAADEVNAQVSGLITSLQGIPADAGAPDMSPVIDLLKSIQCTADGTNINATATLSSGISNMILSEAVQLVEFQQMEETMQQQQQNPGQDVPATQPAGL